MNKPKFGINRLTAAWTVCALVILIASAMLAAGAGGWWGDYLLTIALAFFIITLVVYLRRKERVRYDERDIKVQQKASTYSWFYSYAFIALLIINQQSGFRPLETQAALGLVFFFMLLSQLASRIYFQRQEDI